MISVIMPIYNTEKYLEQAILSVIEQAYREWELLLIDDGSTDSCHEICEHYTNVDNRIRYFWQNNSGVSVARNTGLKEAKGEFIYFLDSDDYIESDCFLILMEEINTQALDFLYFDRNVVGEDSKECSVVLEGDLALLDKCNLNSKKRRQIVSIFLDHKMYFFSGNKIYKKSILDENEIFFKEKMTVGEDAMFTLQYLLCANSIKGIPNKIYNYRIRSTSAMGSNGNKLHVDTYCLCLKDIWERRKQYNLSKSAFHDIFMQVIYDQYGKRMNNEHLHEYVRLVSEKLFLWNNTVYFVLRPWKLKRLYGADRWLDMWKLLILVSSYCIA